MGIRLEYLNFIVPIKKIEKIYPGGWTQCLRDHFELIGGRVWYDDHLFRDGAMDPISCWIIGKNLAFAPTKGAVIRFSGLMYVSSMHFLTRRVCPVTG